MKLKFRIFSWIRIFLYLSIYIIFLVIPTTYFINNTICHFHKITGYLCPTCGVTRAFSSLLHMKLSNAFSYHPVFTILIFPILSFIAFQDTFTVLKREITKSKINSFIEAIFLGIII